MPTRLVLELVLASGCAIAAWAVAQSWQDERVYTVAATLASVAGTLLGFVMAALAILAAVPDRPLVQGMKKTGHFQNLLQDLFYTATGYGVSLLASLAGLFMAQSDGTYLLAFALFAFVIAALRTLRAGHNFYLTMLNL